MVERIKTVMAHYQMKPAQFSDAIGMQRSAVSHVLSGRNKPSLDFVLGIKRHFPDISLNWLTLGEGEMFETRAPVSGDLFSGGTAGGRAKEKEEDIQSVTEAPAPVAQEAEWKEESQAHYGIATAGRDVEKIIFIYSNGTFRIFDPRAGK